MNEETTQTREVMAIAWYICDNKTMPGDNVGEFIQIPEPDVLNW